MLFPFVHTLHDVKITFRSNAVVFHDLVFGSDVYFHCQEAGNVLGEAFVQLPGRCPNKHLTLSRIHDWRGMSCLPSPYWALQYHRSSQAQSPKCSLVVHLHSLVVCYRPNHIQHLVLYHRNYVVGGGEVFFIWPSYFNICTVLKCTIT